MAKPASPLSAESGCMCRDHTEIILLWWSLSSESSVHATNLDISSQTQLGSHRLTLTIVEIQWHQMTLRDTESRHNG
jgi:hypothetical protein